MYLPTGHVLRSASGLLRRPAVRLRGPSGRWLSKCASYMIPRDGPFRRCLKFPSECLSDLLNPADFVEQGEIGGCKDKFFIRIHFDLYSHLMIKFWDPDGEEEGDGPPERETAREENAAVGEQSNGRDSQVVDQRQHRDIRGGREGGIQTEVDLIGSEAFPPSVERQLAVPGSPASDGQPAMTDNQLDMGAQFQLPDYDDGPDPYDNGYDERLGSEEPIMEREEMRGRSEQRGIPDGGNSDDGGRRSEASRSRGFSKGSKGEKRKSVHADSESDDDIPPKKAKTRRPAPSRSTKRIRKGADDDDASDNDEATGARKDNKGKPARSNPPRAARRAAVEYREEDDSMQSGEEKGKVPKKRKKEKPRNRCPYCWVKIVQPEVLRKHISEKHPEGTPPPVDKVKFPDSGRIPCPAEGCGTWVEIATANAHINSHPKPIICRHCGEVASVNRAREEGSPFAECEFFTFRCPTYHFLLF